MEEVIAESSNAHKTKQAEPQRLIDMDWEEMERTIMVDVGAGSIRTTYHVPFGATPQHVIYKYARDVQNDLYLNGYALYTSSQMLPMEEEFMELMYQNLIDTGDKLTIAPIENLF